MRGMRDPHTTKERSLIRVALSALGLVVLIPTLGILFIFREHLEANWLPLFFLLIISLLGFFTLWRIILGISRIIGGLERVSRGEINGIDLEGRGGQIQEMAEIINALNKLTADFKANAVQLEVLIQQFSTLTELTEMTARIPDIQELLKLVLQKAKGATHALRGTVMLVREDGEGMEIVAATGWDPVGGNRVAFHQSLAETVIEKGDPLLVANIETDADLRRQNNSERYSNPSFLIMPLKAKATTIGVVCLSEKENGKPFTDQDRRFLLVLLGQIGYAVENARLLRQARNAAEALQEVVERKETQLQSAQRQILQSEKLSALGQLIAGVAHEINNPLTSVVGYTELILRMPDRNTRKADKSLQTVFEEASRATRIVHNLLSFARTRKTVKSLGDLNEIVKNIVALREYELHTHGIALETNMRANLPPVLVNTDQIQQVLLNLINNSIQALEPGGTRKIEIGTGVDDENVLVWVSDTGKGIPKEIVGRIFEPFFSTKQDSTTNSGLGLNISYGIIKEHGGEIEIESEEGKGTRMIISLPFSQGEVEFHEKPQDALEVPAVDGKTALVVDDEGPIAELVGEILETVGYRVEVFTKGPQALDRLLEVDFDMVVTDLRMPDVDGQQIYQSVKTHRPANLKHFIMTSGDVAEPQVNHFAKSKGIPLLAKPFTRRQFLETALPGKVSTEDL